MTMQVIYAIDMLSIMQRLKPISYFSGLSYQNYCWYVPIIQVFADTFFLFRFISSFGLIYSDTTISLPLNVFNTKYLYLFR